MLRIPLFTEDSFLLLAPRWSGWGDAGQTAALVALLLTPLLLIGGLYRYEMKLVSRRAATLLVALRVLALLLLWSLAGLQPTIAHVEHEDSPSRVLVAVDLSASMRLADPQRTWPEKLRLARVWPMASVEAPFTVAHIRDWLDLAQRGALPRDPLLDALGRTVDAQSRRDVAMRLLVDPHVDLLGRLKKQHHVELLGFDQSLLEGAEQSFFAQLDPKKPHDASATNLNLPLQRGLQSAGKQTGKLLGVVILTDGQHNQGPPPLELAKELARQQVPVFPVAIGSKQPPIDLSVIDVQAPRQVFKDAEATVETKLRVSGLPAQDLVVELSGSGSFKKQQKTIQHDGKNRVYAASFPIKLDEVGAQRLEVRVQPRDSQTRETTTDNNRLGTVIRVAPEKARVLIVEDEPRWEHYYLASALGRDPDLLLDRVLFNPPRIGADSEDKLEKLGHARRQLPSNVGKAEDPLWSYDCIIVGDVSPEQLPTPDRLRLERYVEDRGGTLVVSAGRRHMPLAYFAGAANDPFVKLLPVRQPTLVQPKDGFAFTLVDAGEKTSFFQIEKDADSSRQRWLEMPKHFWGVTGAAKPGAQILARADSPEMPKPKDPTVDTAGLVLQQSYGFGKVLYVGIESTWRWRYRVGDLYHHRFWGQLMRWAVSDAWLPEGNRFVRFGTKAPIYRHDQEVEIAARLGEDAPSIASATARMKLLRKEGDKEELIAAVPLMQDEQRPKQWTGKLKLPAGHYRLEPDIPELRGKLAEAAVGAKTEVGHGFTVLPPEDGELIDVATNWDLLHALAEQTQGRLFTAEDVGELPDLLARQVVHKETRNEQRAWQDAPMVWWALGVLLSLLTIEWIIRKFAGLP